MNLLLNVLRAFSYVNSLVVVPKSDPFRGIIFIVQVKRLHDLELMGPQDAEWCQVGPGHLNVVFQVLI